MEVSKHRLLLSRERRTVERSRTVGRLQMRTFGEYHVAREGSGDTRLSCSRGVCPVDGACVAASQHPRESAPLCTTLLRCYRGGTAAGAPPHVRAAADDRGRRPATKARTGSMPLCTVATGSSPGQLSSTQLRHSTPSLTYKRSLVSCCPSAMLAIAKRVGPREVFGGFGPS